MTASNSQGPIVAVIGSTGSQGGSVIDHLISSDKPYRLRAITRDASKDAAKNLAEKGCEVVEADIDKREDLDRAFKGAEIVFAVTNFWAHCDGERELNDGKRMGDAAVAAGTVKRFIWSGVEHVKNGSGGKFDRVEHFDRKADVTTYLKTLPLPLTVVQAGCYMSNFLGYLPGVEPHLVGEKTVEFTLPMRPEGKLALLDVNRDYGAFVRAALEAETGKDELLACAEEITVQQFVDDFAAATRLSTSFRQVSTDEFVSLFKGQEAMGLELAQMQQWFDEFGYFGSKDFGPSLRIVKDSQAPSTPRSWKDFVAAQDWEWLVKGEKKHE
ncbi:hypothetical protein JCM10207_002612 [Rhodosporidiobolus poonsookiae]